VLDEGEVREVILATNPTVEGEATAHFLAEVTARRGIRAFAHRARRAVGGELGVRGWRTLGTRWRGG